MLFTEMLQTLWGAAFNLAGIRREPESTGPVQVSTSAQRTLAHLLAWDGQNSRLLRCARAGDGGALLTCPFEGLVPPDSSEVLLGVGYTTHDWGSAAPRIVHVDAVVGASTRTIKVYDSLAAGSATVLLGHLGASCGGWYRTANRYLVLYAWDAADGGFVRGWLL